MALLRIVRDSGYTDRIRAYQIVLDGKKYADIRNGETKELTVPPGQHELSVRIDWCGSKTLRFASTGEEAIEFRVKSNLRGPRVALALWYALFDRSSYLHLERTK